MSRTLRADKTLTVQELKRESGIPSADFILHLLEMEPRILLPTLGAHNSLDQSYVPTKEHLYIPYRLPTIQHQIAHMVDMTKLDRCLLPDWGMELNAIFSRKRASVFPALIREVRVRSIQSLLDPSILHLHPSNGPLGLVMFIDSAHFCIRRTPFGRFHSRQDILDYIALLRDKTIKAWSLDRIETEWKTRLTHIQHWMESKG